MCRRLPCSGCCDPSIACKFQLQKGEPYSAVRVCEVLEGESTSEGASWLQTHAFQGIPSDILLVVGFSFGASS